MLLDISWPSLKAAVDSLPKETSTEANVASYGANVTRRLPDV